MTLDSANNNDQDKASDTKGDVNPAEPDRSDECSTYSQSIETTANNREQEAPVNYSYSYGDDVGTCYNKILDDEIRSRLDKLNALSDLINSLERQFDEANSVFRDTLKCSTDRLSSIAKSLGTKSIRHARIYHAAKFSVEQSQSDCQKACVQFEQANKDHQFAKRAINDAEMKLKEIAGSRENVAEPTLDLLESLDLQKLNLEDSRNTSNNRNSNTCDNIGDDSSSNEIDPPESDVRPSATIAIEQASASCETEDQNDARLENVSPTTSLIKNSAKLGEELNQAILKLIEAERQRGLSERQHLNQANKLMIAQENLVKLEREYGPSIRRSQLYFDEARRFNAKLSTVKAEICKINEDVIAAKQAYAQTLSELEQFSDNLHDTPKTTTNSA